MTGRKWTETDHVHPGLEGAHQAKSRNTPRSEKTQTVVSSGDRGTLKRDNLVE